ncbi:hypothetical protein CMZ84_06415 [Lysobacteraceae bacterium NML93-0399]|nr:hypothetical protein CMZ84_06415 [Xanthomonadaceae bacterium NML93-0399]
MALPLKPRRVATVGLPGMLPTIAPSASSNTSRAACAHARDVFAVDDLQRRRRFALAQIGPAAGLVRYIVRAQPLGLHVQRVAGGSSRSTVGRGP